jgi:hypothetical protein
MSLQGTDHVLVYSFFGTSLILLYIHLLVPVLYWLHVGVPIIPSHVTYYDFALYEFEEKSQSHAQNINNPFQNSPKHMISLEHDRSVDRVDGIIIETCNIVPV